MSDLSFEASDVRLELLDEIVFLLRGIHDGH